MAQGRYLDIAWHPDSTILNITSGDPWSGPGTARTAANSPNADSHPPPSDEKQRPSPSSAWMGRTCSSAPPRAGCTYSTHTPSPPSASRSRCTRSAEGEPDPQDVDNFVPSGDLRTVYLNDTIVDYIAGTARHMPDLGFPVVDLYPSPDGKRLIIGTGPTGVGLLDAAAMKWISRPNAAQAGLVGYLTAWSQDGSLVASVNEGRLSHWDGKTGAVPRHGGRAAAGGPSVLNRQQQLLVAGDDGSVLTWDLNPQPGPQLHAASQDATSTEQEWRTYLPNRPSSRPAHPDPPNHRTGPRPERHRPGARARTR